MGEFRKRSLAALDLPGSVRRSTIHDPDKGKPRTTDIGRGRITLQMNPITINESGQAGRHTLDLATLPAAMVPAEADLRSFTWLPIEVTRLRNSTFAIEATGEGFRAALLLWCAAWHQLPASSLPSSDRELAHLAGFGRDLASWLDVKAEALRGFVECSDGRLYHPLLADKAVAAWDSLKANRQRTEGARKKRDEKRRAGSNDNHSDDAGDSVCHNVCDRDSHNDCDRDQRRGEERRGKERTTNDRTSAGSGRHASGTSTPDRARRINTGPAGRHPGPST